MKNLISLEIRKVLLKPHMFGLAAANIIIFLLSVFTSSLLTQNGNMPAFNGLPPAQLDTVSLALMLVRATLIVWEAVFLCVFIIEEYRNRTISLLYTYPVNRTKLMLAKLLLVCGIMLLFHTVSYIFQYACIFLASRYFVFVTFSLGGHMGAGCHSCFSYYVRAFPIVCWDDKEINDCNGCFIHSHCCHCIQFTGLPCRTAVNACCRNNFGHYWDCFFSNGTSQDGCI